jgi:hypothetical protein
MTESLLRVHGRFHILPLPKERDAWFVWSDDQDKPDGPHPVVAVLLPLTEFSWDGIWESYKRGKHIVEFPNDGLNWNISENADLIEPYFLVLWSDMGNNEPWIKKDYVYFTEEAAFQELARLKVKRAEEVAQRASVVESQQSEAEPVAEECEAEAEEIADRIEGENECSGKDRSAVGTCLDPKQVRRN